MFIRILIWTNLMSALLTPLWSQTGCESCYGKNISEIRLMGLRYTKKFIVLRELASQQGQPYKREDESKNWARLDNLDIFSQIAIEPVVENDQVVLEIRVIEIFPYLPFVTYEVTDENGFSIGPGFQSVNLLGRDVLVTAFGRFGGATNVGVLLANPWWRGNHLGYSLEFSQRDRANDLDDFHEKSTEIVAKLSSYAGEHGRVGMRISTLFVESDSSDRTLSASNRDVLPSVGFMVGYDSRDLWSNPHKGWHNEIEIAKHGGFIGADNDYWALTVDVRKYIPVAERHTLGVFSLTTLRTGTVGKDIPVIEDFHIGGTNSIRGWEIGSRGGGKNQMIHTAEYRYTLMKPRLFKFWFLNADIGFQLAAFTDAGLVWNNGGSFGGNKFIAGYGVGFRFLVPFINMLRFDIALGQRGSAPLMHFGNFEKPVAQRFRVR